MMMEESIFEGEIEAAPEAESLSEQNPEAEEPQNSAAQTDKIEDEPIDYEAVAKEDLSRLAAEFPEMRGAASITELSDPLRYAQLRDLGLSPREAYLATSGRGRTPDTRRHLFSAVPKGASAPAGGMSRSELDGARELFPGLGDREIMGLYKKVNA